MHTHTHTRQVISKRKLSTPEEIDDVKREVQIMHHLAGHPNVVKLEGVYEDKANVCLAMEVCSCACVRACMTACVCCMGLVWWFWCVFVGVRGGCRQRSF